MIIFIHSLFIYMENSYLAKTSQSQLKGAELNLMEVTTGKENPSPGIRKRNTRLNRRYEWNRMHSVLINSDKAIKRTTTSNLTQLSLNSLFPFSIKKLESTPLASGYPKTLLRINTRRICNVKDPKVNPWRRNPNPGRTNKNIINCFENLYQKVSFQYSKATNLEIQYSS